ncbi:MAG: folate-binding protein [Arenimonas sp.]
MLSPASNPYKAKSSEAALKPLSGFSLLAASGPDSAAFLQAQLMNDVRALAPGQWQWNGWLNPKGRVICLFALLRCADSDFVAVLPDFPAAELQALLQRFVFRSKLQLRVLDELVAAAGDEALARDGAWPRDRAQAEAAGWRLDFGGDQGERWLHLRPRGEDGLLATDPVLDAAWHGADLAHGLPRLDPGQREAWTPQMLSLQRLHAFSLAKGCYPGQEIVARTHYLGQAKRELVRLRGTELVSGANVAGADGRALGTVVCSRADGVEALAVLQVERAAGPWRAGGEEVAGVPLLDGLQRPL